MNAEQLEASVKYDRPQEAAERGSAEYNAAVEAIGKLIDAHPELSTLTVGLYRLGRFDQAGTEPRAIAPCS